MSLIRHQAQELEAFCHTCPAPQEVTAYLHTMGFTLVFQLPAYIPSASSGVAPLPAQFHYQRPDGSELIFLAGRDAELDGVELPEHASRFWLSPGTDGAGARWLAHVLAVTWSLAWQPLSQARP